MKKNFEDPSFAVFLVIRLSSVWIVQTWFVPDEYWQSLEVAHKLTFSYGYLTWEWFEGIRTLIYPAFFSVLYRFIAYCGVDTPNALIYVPRVFQALFCAWSEWRFSKEIGKILSSSQISWFILLQSSTFFTYYVGSRTLANTLEMNFTMMGITYFLNQRKGLFLFYVMISCYMRVTSVPLWLPFLFLFAQKEIRWIISTSCLKTFIRCLLVLVCLVGLDSWWYGKPTFVPLQFLSFNFLNDFSQFYGEHPWHWYFTNALPTLMGPTLLPLLFSLGCLKSRNKFEGKIIFTIALSAASYTICHSMVGHKEIRFLTPIIPLLNVLAAVVLPNWRWRRVFVVLFYAWNIPVGLYLSMRHQRGVLDATSFLRSIINSNDRVLYLMPCHSTPFYSHLHVNATLRFLTCPPNLSRQKNYIDEADRFYQNPKQWLLENPIPASFEYFVFFDPLLDAISHYLTSNSYHLIGNFFHGDMAQGRVGRRILVYKKFLID